MSASECTQCWNQNGPNVGIRLDNRNELKCRHHNEPKCRNLNGPTVSNGMDPLSAMESWTIGMNMTGQKTACQNNLLGQTSCQVRTVLMSGWNTLSAHFVGTLSCQVWNTSHVWLEHFVGTLFMLDQTTSHVGMQHIVRTLFMSGWGPFLQHFPCRVRTLCISGQNTLSAHFVNLKLQWVVEVVVWVGADWLW